MIEIMILVVCTLQLLVSVAFWLAVAALVRTAFHSR